MTQQRCPSRTRCAFQPILLPKCHFFPIFGTFPNFYAPPLYHSLLRAVQTFEFKDKLNNLDKRISRGAILPSENTAVMLFSLRLCLRYRAGVSACVRHKPAARRPLREGDPINNTAHKRTSETSQSPGFKSQNCQPSTAAPRITF